MIGLRVCIITFLLTTIYFILSIAITNTLFFTQSNGSLIKYRNKIIGSKLIGQNFIKDVYFHSRPSLINYKNDISGNSNFPHYSKELIKNILSNTAKYNNKLFDLNLISESASGLDPHITYKGAIAQADRVSFSTGINRAKLLEVINKKSKPRIFGIFGERIINVLELNLEIVKIYAEETRS